MNTCVLKSAAEFDFHVFVCQTTYFIFSVHFNFINNAPNINSSHLEVLYTAQTPQ